MKVNWLNRALIGGPYLALCMSEREYRAALDWLKVDQSDRPRFVSESADATTHTFEMRGEVTCLVCVGDITKRKDVEIRGLLVHEATHVFDEAMERIGETNPGKEIKAYSIQAISQELMNAYDNWKKKRA